MSVEDVWNEETEEKSVSEESPEPSKEVEVDGDSVPAGEEETKEVVEEEAPAPSKEEDATDWFGDPVEKPIAEHPVEESVEKKASETPVAETIEAETPEADTPVAAVTPTTVDDEHPHEKEPVKEKADVESPAEEKPTTAVLAETDAWFTPAVEKPIGEKPIDDQTIDESVKEKVDEDSPVEDSPAAETLSEVNDDWFIPAEDQSTAETPPEVSTDAIVPMSIEASPIVCQAVSAEAMKAQMRQFQSLKAGLLDTSDVVTIKNRPFIKRSGWRKMGLAFNLSDDIIKEVRNDFEGGFRWRMWVKVTAPNGRSVVGVGGCSSEERDFAHLEHDVYSICHTRAKNRALSDMIGSGEVSFEELRGMN